MSSRPTIVLSLCLVNALAASGLACDSTSSKEPLAALPVEEPNTLDRAPQVEPGAAVEARAAAPLEPSADDSQVHEAAAAEASAEASAEPPRSKDVVSLIPESILPARCSKNHEDPESEKVVAWDGQRNFELGCSRPGLDGWKKVAKAEDYAAGTAYVSHAYRKSGWMLLFGERCCSVCEPDKLTNCEPWATAHLYPPSDLEDCANSRICADIGLCVQEQGWCAPADENWAVSF